jgi:hypothetical protein
MKVLITNYFYNINSAFKNDTPLPKTYKKCDYTLVLKPHIGKTRNAITLVQNDNHVYIYIYTYVTNVLLFHRHGVEFVQLPLDL